MEDLVGAKYNIIQKMYKMLIADVQCKVKVKRRIIDNMLRGKVEIVSQEVLIIQQAYIEITGLASCSWKLDEYCFKFPRLYPKGTSVKGLQQFYYTRHVLCGGEIPHKHTSREFYNFKCYWPSRLPGSWIGDHGTIEYIAKITMKLENRLDVYTYSQPVLVQHRRCLETEEHLLFDERIDVARNFHTTRSVEKVSVSVWLPISGIAAGQSLPVLCSVTNRSNLHFGSLLFVITRIDIYRSDTPVKIVKEVRTDVCRIAQMVSIHQGRYDYFAILRTSPDMVPTNQFYTCTCCQVIYEVWVSLQGAFKRYRSFGYPNIDTPGLPIIIGTKPLRNYNCYEITGEIFKKLYEFVVPTYMDELPEDFRQIITTTEDDLSKEAIQNLERQLAVVNAQNTKQSNDLKKTKPKVL